MALLEAMEDNYVVKAVTEVPVTLALVAAVCLTGVLQEAVGSLGDIEALIALGAVSREHLELWGIWRLLASSWLHYDLSHLIGNLSLLLPLGLMVESVIGSRRMLVVFAASTTLGSAGTLFIHMPRAGIGNSDGVFGLLGVAMVMAIAPRGRLTSHQSSALRRFLLPMSWMALLRSFAPSVSVGGHAVGLAVGILAAATGLLWFGVPRRYEDQVHSFDAGSALKWTFAAMTCGCADFALGLITIAVCVGVWMELADDAAPPTDLLGPSTWAGALGALVLGAGWLTVVGLAWPQLDLGAAEVPEGVVLHPDLPLFRTWEGQEIEVIDRPASLDEAIGILLEGVKRPAVVDLDACPTLWWDRCVHRLFPTVVVRACFTGRQVREWACEPELLDPLHQGLLYEGAGNRPQATLQFQAAREADPANPRAAILAASGCGEVVAAMKMAAAGEDANAWRDGIRIGKECDARLAEKLARLLAQKEGG